MQNHSCQVLPCDHPDMVWTDEVPTRQTCGRATHNTNVTDCGFEVSQQRLINLYRGGRCDRNMCVHDETTVVIGQIESPVFIRYIGSTPCTIGW